MPTPQPRTTRMSPPSLTLLTSPLWLRCLLAAGIVIVLLIATAWATSIR